MHEDKTASYRPPEASAAKAGHEVADISLGGIKIFGVILFGTIFLTLILMSGLLWGYMKYLDSQEAARSPIVTEVPIPPEPMLQPSRYHNTLDWIDLKNLHREEDAKLNDSYQWVGNEKKAARIPIAQAIDLILSKKSLPVRSGDPTGNMLTPTPTGGAAGIMNNAANPLNHAAPIAGQTNGPD